MSVAQGEESQVILQVGDAADYAVRKDAYHSQGLKLVPVNLGRKPSWSTMRNSSPSTIRTAPSHSACRLSSLAENRPFLARRLRPASKELAVRFWQHAGVTASVTGSKIDYS